MEGFILGFLSSILASVTYVLLGFLFKNRIQGFIQRSFYQLLGMGIDGVYPSLEIFEPELSKLCKTSSQISVLAFRGSGGCKFLYTNRKELKNKHIEVLIIDPFDKKGQYWIAQRENEVTVSGYYDTNEREAIVPYLQMVKNSVRDLSILQDLVDDLKIYLYNSKAIWTMYIFDNKIGFLGGYTAENLGRLGSYYKVSGKNLLLDISIRHFEYLRDHCSVLYEENPLES